MSVRSDASAAIVVYGHPFCGETRTAAKGSAYAASMCASVAVVLLTCSAMQGFDWYLHCTRHETSTGAIRVLVDSALTT